MEIFSMIGHHTAVYVGDHTIDCLRSSLSQWPLRCLWILFRCIIVTVVNAELIWLCVDVIFSSIHHIKYLYAWCLCSLRG